MNKKMEEGFLSTTLAVGAALLFARNMWKKYKEQSIQARNEKIRQDSLKKSELYAKKYNALMNKKYRHDGKLMTLSQIKKSALEKFDKRVR